MAAPRAARSTSRSSRCSRRSSSITGGIYLRGSLAGTPLVNTALLGDRRAPRELHRHDRRVGAADPAAAARERAARQRKAHIVVFFIFIVSNCGGLLTPLGDPPLFLGFLKGVPFGWTLQLWPQWLLVNGVLLVIFNVWDQLVLDREERERPGSQLEEVMEIDEPLRIEGARQLPVPGRRDRR